MALQINQCLNLYTWGDEMMQESLHQYMSWYWVVIIFLYLVATALLLFIESMRTSPYTAP